MNTVLSVQGASAPVEKKSFFSKFTRLNMLRLARAVIPAAVLMMFFPQLAMAAQGQDLMASGNTTVKATFGKDSSVVKWVVLAEVLVGACRYDTEGYVTEHISQEEEAYAAARLDKIRRQNRIKAELQAVLDEK